MHQFNRENVRIDEKTELFFEFISDGRFLDSSAQVLFTVGPFFRFNV